MEPSGTIPREMEDRVLQELDADEKVFWMAQPVLSYFGGSRLAAYIVSIPILAFCSYIIISQIMIQPRWWTFGLPDEATTYFFGAIGFLILFGALHDYGRTRRTVYVLTDRRAMCCEIDHTTKILSYRLDMLAMSVRKEKRSGIGDVVFYVTRVETEDGANHRDKGFLGIRNAREVEALMRELVEKAIAHRAL